MNDTARIRAPILVIVLLVLFGTAALYLGSTKSNAPSARAEALRQELVLTNGALHLTNTLTLFTGVLIEKYPDGQIQSRSHIKDGLLEGRSEGWFTNGVKQVEEQFTRGVSHGLRVKWHPNGQKLSEAPIVHGKIDGLFRRWHDNGRLAEEIQMRAGEPDGASMAYYPNGHLKAEATLKNGVVLTQTFWQEEDRKPAPSSR